MHARQLVPVTAAVLLLAGCGEDDGIGAAQPGDVTDSPTVPVDASADLRDLDGSVLGTATFTDQDNGVQVEVEVTGMSTGPHGVYLLEVGRCEPAGTDPTDSAGAWAGDRARDLPALQVTEAEVGSLSTLVGSVDLADLLAGDGTALVIDAGPVASAAEPGASAAPGSRTACGVIGR